MGLVASAVVGAIAILHIYILVLEMFWWTKPRGLRVFHQTLEQAKASAVLAANQGLYNGFLAAGLIWAIFHPAPDASRQIATFFLGCIAIAGGFGAATVNIRIMYIQSVPAILALAVIWL